ncbi:MULTISPECIES: ATP-binding protein [unclassified Bradyrhizobium]
MQELRTYLGTQFLSDNQEIDQVNRLLSEVATTLLASHSGPLGWCYQINQDGGPEAPKGLSFSTTGMVTRALTALLPRSFASSPVNPLPFEVRNLDNKLVDQARKAVSDARNVLCDAILKENPPKMVSSTFGINDPMTLAFVSGVFNPNQAASREDEIKVVAFLAEQAQRLIKLDPAKKDLIKPNKETHAVRNALIPLRVVQACRNLQVQPAVELNQYQRYFETTLHEHLSYSSIPDSRFDPAELTFCVEGLLLSRLGAMDRPIFKRVLEVLATAQRENAFWRPNKPFLATSKGLSLFPVSIEVANSLLRSSELYDGAELFDTFSAECVVLLRRYWQWLNARTLRFDVGGTQYTGWNSEHVNEFNSIHVWETSQVLEFLIGYRRFLQTHVARTSLVLSHFNVKPVTLPKKKGDEWAKYEADYEPVSCLGSGYKVYESIGREFVLGWGGGAPTNYSCLLYGPPGTGKTTVAENLAKALSTRIINISVSDFLAGGSAEVEARAKAIFEVLNSQMRCVVLMDEIDQLILDRDSTRYSAQQDIFQFMTPGMLTKLNDLRARKGVIFIIATNYADRIDSAIKRSGRIDRKYLVLPPDKTARKRIVNQILTSPPVDCAIKVDSLNEDHWTALQDASLFLGFSDIKGAIFGLEGQQANLEDVVRSLRDRQRTIQLGKYKLRFDRALEQGGSLSQEAIEEFVCLLALASECTDRAGMNDPAISSAAKYFKGLLSGGTFATAVASSVPALEQSMTNAVAQILEESV